MHTDACPAPVCEVANVDKLHIYHFRSPSIEDAFKKIVDWKYRETQEGEEELMSDEGYEAATWFFNQVRDISMTRFGPALRERIAPLLSFPPSRLTT